MADEKNIMLIKLETESGDPIVETNDAMYIIKEDKVTGDWNVFCENDDMVMDEWMKTKDDAIKFALVKAGVLEDADYTRAPTRVDA